MDYAGLETILELKTIKHLRSNLRIYVEHPAGSGTFMKLRPWKAQDGSLQAILLQSFFDERLQGGTVTNIDVRDSPEGIKQASKSADWLRAQVSNMTGSLSNGSNAEGQNVEANKVRWLLFRTALQTLINL